MLFLEERCALQGHRAADMIISGLDVLLREAQMLQKIEARIIQLGLRNAQGFGAEFLTQGPLVEHKADIKGLWQSRFDLVQFSLTKPMPHQGGMVDTRRIAKRAMADRIGNDFFNLGRRIPQFFQGGRHRAVDDFEVTTTGQFLELNQGEIGLDACCVAIHDQTDCARWRNHSGLSVAIAMLLAQIQRLIPCLFGQIDQTRIRAVGVI